MSPKKAIIILVIFTLAISGVAAWFYTKKERGNNLKNEAGIENTANVGNIAEEKVLTPEQKKEESINVLQAETEAIIAEDLKDDGAITSETREEVVNMINAEIQKQEQDKPQAQLEEEKRVQDQRRAIVDEINKKIAQ